MVVEQNSGDVSISVHRCDSKSELLSCLESFEKSIVVFDKEASARNFALIKVRCPNEKWSVGCGLFYDSPICPQIVSHSKRFMRWVLLDQMLFLLDVREATIILQQRLPSTFYDVVCINNDAIVVVHELGVEAINQEGRSIWQIVGHDILVECRQEGGQIICQFEDGQVMSHKL